MFLRHCSPQWPQQIILVCCSWHQPLPCRWVISGTSLCQGCPLFRALALPRSGPLLPEKRESLSSRGGRDFRNFDETKGLQETSGCKTRCGLFCRLASGLDAHRQQAQSEYGTLLWPVQLPCLSLSPGPPNIQREDQGAGALRGLGDEAVACVCVSGPDWSRNLCLQLPCQPLNAFLYV